MMQPNLDSSLAVSANWRDYLELTKPKVVLLMLITALVGMQLSSPALVPFDTLLITFIGLALAMGGAAAVNHVVDQKIDALMSRTANRPIAAGRLNHTHALWFAASLCVFSIIWLAVLVNHLTAALTLFGVVGYAVIYTFYLKRATPQNIVIGGLAGAIPPLLGWTAVTNQIDGNALLLVLIIYVWTPPHFWALAIARQQEYATAKIPMLPVTHGIDFTKTSILLYTWLLIAVSYLPFLTHLSGLFYMLVVTLLNGIFLYYAVQLKWFARPGTAMRTFGYSIVYLFALFIALLIDHTGWIN